MPPKPGIEACLLRTLPFPILKRLTLFERSDFSLPNVTLAVKNSRNRYQPKRSLPESPEDLPEKEGQGCTFPRRYDLAVKKIVPVAGRKSKYSRGKKQDFSHRLTSRGGLAVFPLIGIRPIRAVVALGCL